jgi:hypothetical protein
MVKQFGKIKSSALELKTAVIKIMGSETNITLPGKGLK